MERRVFGKHREVRERRRIDRWSDKVERRLLRKRDKRRMKGKRILDRDGDRWMIKTMWSGEES